MRWLEFLSRFNFQIVYRPGTANARADALSRKLEDMPKDVKDDRLKNRKRPLIKSENFDLEMFDNLELFTLDTLRYVDDVIADSYSKLLFMTKVVDTLR